MTIGEHLTEFGGFQVTQWEPGQPLADTATTIHRIAVDYDDETDWTDKFRAFLALPGWKAVRVWWWACGPTRTWKATSPP